MSEALITLFTTLGEAFTQAAEDLAAEAEENETPEPEPEPEPKKAPAGRGKKKPEPEPEPEPKKAPAGRGKKKKPEPEPEPEDDAVTLEDLQELASTLLEAGQRKVLKGVLDEAGVKSLSAAEEDQYDDIYDALYDAVEALS